MGVKVFLHPAHGEKAMPIVPQPGFILPLQLGWPHTGNERPPTRAVGNLQFKKQDPSRGTIGWGPFSDASVACRVYCDERD